MKGSSAALDALRARYQEGRLVPFIGAGASMAVEWEEDGQTHRGISWAELVDHAALLLGYEDADMLRVRGTDLQILEYYVQKRDGETAELRNWLAQKFTASNEVLSQSVVHSALARLTRCPVMYTTNYDNYIERSLQLAGHKAATVAVERHIAEVISSDADSEDKTIQVVKFHGDLNNPEWMVLSESDYDRRMRFEGVEDRRLTSDALGRVVLFMGYSFRDANVSYLFRLMNDALGPLPLDSTGRRAYILIPEPSDFEVTLYRARNIEVIPISSDLMAVDTAAILEGLV